MLRMLPGPPDVEGVDSDVGRSLSRCPSSWSWHRSTSARLSSVLPCSRTPTSSRHERSALVTVPFQVLC
eukprot:2508040-Rhodomonas_salina.1